MKKIKLILIITFISFIIALISLYGIGKKLSLSILEYSKIEAERFGVYIINFSLDKNFINSLDEDVFKTKVNEKGEIQMIDFDAKKVNMLLEQVTEEIQYNLIKLENGEINHMNIADTFKGFKYNGIKKGVVCELPTGIIHSNFLFSNFGPNIPVKLNFIGQVLTNLNTNVKSYGINSVYLEVMIHVEIDELITMPMRTEKVRIQTDIPLTIKIIQGTVPNYYYPLLEKDSSIFTLPIE